jgi:hypothetical protein
LDDFYENFQFFENEISLNFVKICEILRNESGPFRSSNTSFNAVFFIMFRWKYSSIRQHLRQVHNTTIQDYEARYMETEPIPPSASSSSFSLAMDPLVALHEQAMNPCHEVSSAVSSSPSPQPKIGAAVLPPPPPLKASPAALAAARGLQRQQQQHATTLLQMAAVAATYAATAAAAATPVSSPAPVSKGEILEFWREI